MDDVGEPADACGELAPLPERLQVAWVSRVGTQVSGRTPLPVVRTSDLRRLVEAEKRDPTGVLQALGLVSGKKARGSWKVVVFDVERDWLCRPVETEPGADLSGVPACETGWQRPGVGVKPRSFTGCGYLKDTRTGERTLDTFRVDWQTAVSWGFCVLPLERFLEGA